jgi:endonuclease G
LIALALWLYENRSRAVTPSGKLPAELVMPELVKSVKSQIIGHLGYTVSYNEQRRNPNWVAYELTAEEVAGLESRGDDFVKDPQVVGRQADDSDYRKSGWDRGHLAPAADMKWSPEAMAESFYMSNISPQNNNLNRGVWKQIEEKVRDIAVEYGSVIVVTGPVFTTKKGLGSIGKSRVLIPNAFYKVLLVDNGGYETIGFYCENIAGKKALSSYVMSVDQIEEITGIDFFPALPDDVENVVESRYDLKAWSIKAAKKK